MNCSNVLLGCKINLKDENELKEHLETCVYRLIEQNQKLIEINKKLVLTCQVLKENNSNNLETKERKIIQLENYSSEETTSGLIRFTRKEILVLLNNGSKGKGLQLPHCDLSDLDLRNLNLSNSNFSGSVMKNCKLDNSLLESAIFNNCDLSNSSMKDSDLKKAVFENTLLINASFENSDMQYVTLTGSNLTNSNLKNSNLQVNFKHKISLLIFLIQNLKML
jgi:uncharacterized protein YjbI with pentapeptide repeats